tara:strand:- start:272 stop:487 length:216 start_codon:yes stop_codon:yes gene_type:complete
MTDIILISTLLKLGLSLLAFACAWGGLRLFDIATGFNFKNWIKHADHHSISNYLGFRQLAICILFGLILSS